MTNETDNLKLTIKLTGITAEIGKLILDNMELCSDDPNMHLWMCNGVRVLQGEHWKFDPTIRFETW